MIVKPTNSATNPSVNKFTARGPISQAGSRNDSDHNTELTRALGNATSSTLFARQGPGPNQVESTVQVNSWHGPN
jgi:hypothetical protein